ncbi:MAG TPA: hypothetical protein VM925_05965 [Labilithrix sp.]|nr:hypothetical protein [Labilithrix sp.]
MFRDSRRAPAVLLALATLLACSSRTSSLPAGADAPADDAGADAPSASPSPDPADAANDDASSTKGAIAASEYCESIADFFCDFYLRCGRMVAANKAECRTVFIETCNARYEPRYIDLDRAKLLSLSREGVEACSEHLAKVACIEQVSDLDGPCAAMWLGSAPAGARCAPDVESFVCTPGTTCVVDLDLCGECETAAPRGGPCEPGGTRCAGADACVDGECIARALSGQPCSDKKPCVVGSTCSENTCVSPVVVSEGAACDSKHRCAYRSYCDAGKCARASLLGESCEATRACASGRCEAGKCVPLRAAGETCASNGECSSAQCIDGECTPLPSSCLRQ